MQILIPHRQEINLTFLSAWKRGIEATVKVVRDILVDRQILLEERWEMYLVIRPYLEVEDCYHDFQTLEDIRETSWYDDFYLEKGETMKLDDKFVELATEKFELNSEQTKSLKTEILEYAHKKGYGAFVNDW